MKTAILNIKIDPKVKREAQKVAHDLGFSISTLVNASLKELTRKKSVSFSLLEPSPKLKAAIRSYQRDKKAGKLIGPFSNVKDFTKSLES